jgi:hypothetical protein
MGHFIQPFRSHHHVEYKFMCENLTMLYTMNVSGFVAVLKEMLYNAV